MSAAGASGVVVIYFSRGGAPLRAHQKVMLTADAQAIARLQRYDFAGQHDHARSYDGHVFFVPDDTLLLDEARSLGIRGPSDLYGGVVPHPFVKTKSISHPLVGKNAQRPDGWSLAFSARVRDVVLPGYSAFCAADARTAACRMLPRGPIRVKEPLHAGGQGQTLIASERELDRLLERLPANDIATCGLVLEANLTEVTTRSVGQIAVGAVTISYHGTQRVTTDNNGQQVYGGSDLICVRGGWDAFDRLSLPVPVCVGVAEAKRYDEAMGEYSGFIASRRNYDVAQGIDDEGQQRSGVLESSWRAGGATAAELVAMTAFLEDQSVQMVEACHIEEFGRHREAPRGAAVHFQGDDPQAGPMIRYTQVMSIHR